ncbi:putative exported protein [Lysobacter capsici AZ78]|uniref:Exported protein n=1 Tax=Lysobacter capsici AZ78 TaxID=1444315 RepID=A0A120AH35_9GAMM|nr:lysozyme inhibitor LprI family protein [Lysobacter capsici]KWS05526.1 putative exported protein [Lysobacter capsici AZ78]
MRHALSLALLSLCASLVATGWSGDAAAAGIACAKAASKNERAICADPVLGRRDGELAQAYRAALKASAYGGQLKKDQLAWIKERDRCDGQVRCLRMAYVERLTELQPAAIAGKFQWDGDWTRSDGGATLNLKSLGGDKYQIELQASSGANTGLLSGRARAVNDNEMVYKGKTGAEGDNSRCELTFHRFHRQLQIEQQHTSNDCGAGLGVHFSGRYLPGLGEAVATTQWNLLDLGLLLKPEDDASLRRLLGDDYDLLVERLDVIDTRADQEGLDATVTNGYVRGLASDMRALLIQSADGGKFWVAIRAQDKQGKPELRYYSNDPAWTAKLPRTIDTWSDGYQEHPPVRLMSAGGRVLRSP